MDLTRISISHDAIQHLRLINVNKDQEKNSPSDTDRDHRLEKLKTAPLFSGHVCMAIENHGSSTSCRFPQYGLLGLQVHDDSHTIDHRKLMYANVSMPWSAFICGSQGSGKSHTLSCLLENALIVSSPAGNVSAPLAGMVVHYDKFTSFSGTQLCEAAYLCSSNIPVRILVSPTNYAAMKKAYENLPGLKGGSRSLEVVPMYLSHKHLTITMMKTLMGIGTGKDQPLYIEMVTKILREMATESQGKPFNYNEFKNRIEQAEFLKGQSLPLKMRLEVLESFFEPRLARKKGHKGPRKDPAMKTWEFKKGSLTIVDLSCPFIGPDDACALFNICVSLFLEGRSDAGRMIALDEAHKFLNTSSVEAVEFTETLLSIVRQQRHLGARVMIATQEPTVSPALLDLCNVTILHRFNSPAWYKAIEAHIAGAAMASRKASQANASDLFQQIVQLETGEALVFCPTALLKSTGCATDAKMSEDEDPKTSNAIWTSLAGLNLGLNPARDLEVRDVEVRDVEVRDDIAELGSGYVRLKIRERITVDGGKSILA